MPSLLTAISSSSRVGMYLLFSCKFSICCSLSGLLYSALGMLQLQSQNGWLPLLWLHKMASLQPAEYSTEMICMSVFITSNNSPSKQWQNVCKSQTLAQISFLTSLQYEIEKIKDKRCISRAVAVGFTVHCTVKPTAAAVHQSQLYFLQLFFFFNQALRYLHGCILINFSCSPECAFWWLLSQWVLHQKKSRRGLKNVHMLFRPGQTRDLESVEKQ